MGFAKIVQDGTTLIDLTQDTVSAESMLSGVTAHKNDGTLVTGNIVQRTDVDITVANGQATILAGAYGQTTKIVDSRTMQINSTYNAQSDIDVRGKAYANVTGINVPASGAFSIIVPNGQSTATFIFNVDSNGNVTITES